MITIQVSNPVMDKDAKFTEKRYVEGRCLSTDTKPTDWANGSLLLEMDTATLYMFDEESKTWKEWS